LILKHKLPALYCEGNYNYMKKRENEIFRGDLTDRELGIIEDALETYANELGDDLRAIEATKLITKLYKFWEVK